MGKIRVAIAGVGNCASSLVQGVQYYQHVTEKHARVPGLMHNVFGNYKVSDVEFVAAFDVDKRKVGKDLSKAVFEKPNCTQVFQKKIPVLNVEVKKGPVLDGVAGHLVQYPDERRFVVDESQKPVDVEQILRESRADVLINYMPVGSQKATEFYAQACLNTGCAMVNCMPVFIASDQKWANRFSEAGLPIVGDDIKSQLGATIVHRVLAKLADDRGIAIRGTYQLNVGGNSVTGDQSVLLEVNGSIQNFSIGDFIDSQMHLNRPVNYSEKEILDLTQPNSPQVNCFTIDNDFRVIQAPVTKLIRHKINEELYKIFFSDGKQIIITGDHNLFTLEEDGSIKCVAAKELAAEKTMVLAPATLETYRDELKEIDLFPHVSSLRAKVQGGYLSVHANPQIKIPLRLPLNTGLLELTGLWIADGNYDRQGSSNVEIAVGNDEECVAVVHNFASQLGIKYAIKENIAVRIQSKTMGAIFKQVLGLNGDCYTKRVPSWIFNLSTPQIAAVLRGYLSGDGCVIGKQVRWTSVSKELIDDIQSLFLRIGIYSTSFKEAAHKPKYKSRGVFWHGIISAQEELQKFSLLVGFLQNNKNQALSKVVNIRNFSKKFLPKVNLFSQLGIKPTTTYKLNRIEKRIVLSQLYKVNDHWTKALLKKICSDEICYLTVKKIEKLPKKEQFVYDLSVESFERFICSNILVHNTDFLNMKEQSRLTSKKISKTEAVQSQLDVPLSWEQIHIGPSDYVPFLNDNKVCFLRVEGTQFGDIPMNIELRLSVEDSPNSAGVVIDALRAAKIALDRKIGGPLIGPSAYFMKHPITQFSDEEARKMVEEFILEKEKEKSAVREMA